MRAKSLFEELHILHSARLVERPQQSDKTVVQRNQRLESDDYWRKFHQIEWDRYRIALRDISSDESLIGTWCGVDEHRVLREPETATHLSGWEDVPVKVSNLTPYTLELDIRH
jgi:hypothetical protein